MKRLQIHNFKNIGSDDPLAVEIEQVGVSDAKD